MQWLKQVVDEIEDKHPEGEVLVESGVSPSGTYHVGTLREVLTQDAIVRELQKRGRKAKHVHYVDDLDPLRKIPVNVPADFEKYLGQPYCDVPAPDGSDQSYADYFLNDFLSAAKKLKLDMEVIRSHEKYRSGFMEPAIEKALEQNDKIGRILVEVSGRQLDDTWSPVQINEDGYLKNRKFVSLNKTAKTITYEDVDSQPQTISYAKGDVKLNWRIDWPARWWLLKVDAEPFGRDHATKGGSYDTGAAIVKDVFGADPPIPIPYQFINQTGETKKMSKSTGNIIAISEMVEVLPPEVVRFFVLRYPPSKQLFFDQHGGVSRLIDEYAELLAKPNKSDEEEELVAMSQVDLEPTVSSMPFSHLVESYQAALKEAGKTLDVLSRTEHATAAKSEAETIKRELKFIDSWLAKWAPADAKFELADKPPTGLDENEQKFLVGLAGKMEAAGNEDGEWFHKVIYETAQSHSLEPKAAFQVIYKTTIGQDHGPRAGWFLSILPRDWLIKRLKLEA